ncbi:MAG: hypothetical protein IKQ20_02880 [Bacteroidales bacterium]|nr:hypothetical protein [Bacteroidales bacterium]
MQKSTKIYNVIGGVFIFLLLIMAIGNAMCGQWVDTFCNALWIGTTVMMIIQSRKNCELWNDKESIVDRLAEAITTVHRQNMEIIQLKNLLMEKQFPSIPQGKMSREELRKKALDVINECDVIIKDHYMGVRGYDNTVSQAYRNHNIAMRVRYFTSDVPIEQKRNYHRAIVKDMRGQGLHRMWL